MTERIFAGDLAQYSGRSCVVMHHTAKRVAILVRLDSGALAWRYVKSGNLKRVGGGLLNADTEREG